ncbi:MAG: HAD superfamily hydrolase [uncultured bacterium (gcode 4)]|uniref:HAD superfamily hydrolase n=1 Tax=uncultured bacterium (gcode 4) TaxID=1234023 RepID=K1XI69_9BACT|nr:MAG: HAD superfamily hydrolase [uncultured bacterium (gcode 4)]
MKEKKLIAFDLYDTCFSIQGEHLCYAQLFSDLWISDRRRELKKVLLTSNTPIENIIPDILPKNKIDEYLYIYRNALRNEINSVWLFPETSSVLFALKERWYKIAAISNIAQPYIESLNTLLPHTFDYEVLSCNVGLIKPDKKIFDCLKNISWYHADQIVMVGNSLSSDVQGAKNADIDPVHVNRASSWIIQHKGYISISSLEQLLDILK